LSAEKFFCIRSRMFLLASEALLLFLYVVSGSASAVLGCASMLVSVTFNVGMRDAWMLKSSVAGRLCGRRRRHTLKIIFFHVSARSCVDVIVRVLPVASTSLHGWEDCVQVEGELRLSPSSPVLQCALVSVDVALVILTRVVLNEGCGAGLDS
jgi:hypothetical protein